MRIHESGNLEWNSGDMKERRPLDKPGDFITGKLSEAEKSIFAGFRQKQEVMGDANTEPNVREKGDLFKEFGFDKNKFKDTIRKPSLEKVDIPHDFEALFDKFSDESVYTYLNDRLKKDVKNRKGGPNCYAFALGWTVNPRTGSPFLTKPSPGDISGEHVDFQDTLRFGSPDTIKKILSCYIKRDLDTLGKEMVEVSGNYVPQKGERMIAMMSAPYIVSPIGAFGDFHFMLRGEKGLWYHKRGIENPTYLDESSKPILDPARCDRGMYTDFEGYFVIRNKGEEEP